MRIPFLSSTVCMFTGMSIATPGFPEFNLYDIREPCVTMGLCYPDDHLWQLMNSYEYREMMNIPFDDDAKQWEMCAMAPHFFLMNDFDYSRGYQLAPLLDKGLPVLIYNGDKDYICNWMGGYAWVSALVWEGQEEFRRDTWKNWVNEEGDRIIGMFKNFENLTFLKFYDAGHMVPMDQPENAYRMID